MIKQYQNSVIAQLLEAIISQVNFDGEPISNIGEILLSILEQTPYDKEPKSVLAELFLKLKDKLEGRAFTPYDKEPKSAIAEILLSILNETEYDKQPNSRIAELLLELKAELENYIELTASGAIANFTTSVVKPLINLKAYFNATQEAGTPTPQSPKAISGVSAVNVIRCGVNLLSTHQGNGYVAERYLVESGAEWIPSTNPQNWFVTEYIACPDSLHFSCDSVGNAPSIVFYDANKHYISGVQYQNRTDFQITIPNGAKFFRASVNKIVNMMLVNGTTAINYEPYNGNVVTIALGGTYYGGYVSQDKNGKRELVVTHEIKELGSLSWTKESFNNKFHWYSSLVTDLKQNSSFTANANLVCSNYSSVATNTLYSGIDGISSYDRRFYIYDTDYDSSTTPSTPFKEYLSGAKVIYELVEPIEIELPDGEPIVAFNGVNNVYNDSGDTSVTYLALISDNITRGAKARATLKAEKLKAKEIEEQKEQIVLDPVEVIKEKPTKGA